jgi:regulator of sirC expression with transglutaminase-like and TPR domain
MAHSPYTVEILRPDEIRMPLAEAHTLLGTMSAITAEYKRYILTKLSKPDELARLQDNLKQRAEMGKKIMKKGEK